MNLNGKKALIVGIANDKSIAYGIARELKDAGAKIYMTVQNEKTMRFTGEVVDRLDADVRVMDLTDLGSVCTTAVGYRNEAVHFDFVVHAVAFSTAKALNGPVHAVTEEDFALTMNVSAYSFIRLVQQFQGQLMPGASIITISYLGSQRAVKGYGIMGVAKAALESSARYLASELAANGHRVNILSPGPISTRAASGIAGFKKLLDHNDIASPLGSVTLGQVGRAGFALLTTPGVTGQTFYVDGGYTAVDAA